MEETPANEKSCQTDEITGEAAVPGPDHASKTLGKLLISACLLNLK